MGVGQDNIGLCKICRRFLIEATFTDDLLFHLERHMDELSKLHSLDDSMRHFKFIKIKRSFLL